MIGEQFPPAPGLCAKLGLTFQGTRVWNWYSSPPLTVGHTDNERVSESVLSRASSRCSDTKGWLMALSLSLTHIQLLSVEQEFVCVCVCLCSRSVLKPGPTYTHTHRQRGQRRLVSETNSTAIKSKSAVWQHFAFPISHSIMQSFAVWQIMFVSLTKQRSSTHARHLHFILLWAAQHTWQHIERKIVPFVVRRDVLNPSHVCCLHSP